MLTAREMARLDASDYRASSRSLQRQGRISLAGPLFWSCRTDGCPLPRGHAVCSVLVVGSLIPKTKGPVAGLKEHNGAREVKGEPGTLPDQQGLERGVNVIAFGQIATLSPSLQIH